MSNKARLVMLVICLILVGVVIWANCFFQPEEPTYVKLRDHEYVDRSGSRPDAPFGDMRQVTFHRDVAEDFDPKHIGERPGITTYTVHKDDVIPLIRVLEVDPDSEVIQRDPRLYRVRVAEPYFTDPSIYKHGISTLRWGTIKTWSISDDK